MSANRANMNWHLVNMIGGQTPANVPLRGIGGYAAGAPYFKTNGRIGLGLYINRGTFDSCDFRGVNGQSPLLAGGEEQLLYEEDLTQNYDIGAIEKLPDGREFRYSKSTGASILMPKRGCGFTDTGYIQYTSFVVAAAQGVSEITVPAATHAALLKDQLRGGYIVIFDGSAVNDVTHEIVGNDAADSGALFKVRLATPLAVTISTSDACEVYSNPWSALAFGSTILPFAGCPMYSVTAAATHFWCQTKGMKFVDPQTGVGADNGGLLNYWRHDGTLQKGETATADVTPAFDTNQPAAIVVAGSAAGNGPLVSLLGI